MILLDTDVCIELLRGNKYVIKKRENEGDTIGISFLTVGELFYGAFKSNKVEHNLIQVEKFLLSVKIVQSDYDIMKIFGEMKATLTKKNILLPDADILIAATSLSKCNKLITGNTDHFKRIDELKIENWIR
jgi:predicted nucleic acid-binding protein